MATWRDVVKFCNEHYYDCYKCPIRGACREELAGRGSKEIENDMIEALNSYYQKEAD